MFENICSGLIANLLSAILILAFGWIIFNLTERKKLLGFFNIDVTKKMVIYLSNLRVNQGGAFGIDNLPRGYYGMAVVYNEHVIASKYKEKFNYLVPSLSESPSFMSKILFADIKITVLPSPLTENEIEVNPSIISFGSPGYNFVSRFIENNDHSVMEFVNDNREVQVTHLPNFTNGEIGFIQKLVIDSNGVKRSLFYTAGISERGTVGAANFLVNNWKVLRKRYGDNKSFIIAIRFPNDNIDNYTIDFERAIE